jgi:CRISP-associated protein Cas1
VEVDGRRAVPVDYKRGEKPDVPEGAYEPERVQLCAQGLVLRDNGFDCERGVIYFAGSKDRVEVAFDEALVRRTREIVASLKSVAASGRIPPPLDASPKCNGCSLVAICLPDETGMLMEPEVAARTEPRRLVPARDDALPVYVQSQGAYASKDGETIAIKEKGVKVAEAKLYETAQLNLLGNVQVSTQLVQELCRRGVPITYASSGGWFYGMTLGPMHKNVEIRLHQYRAAIDSERSLALARRFVATKIRNSRTMLRRNAEGLDDRALDRLEELAVSAESASSAESLLGVEGTAARLYFEGFPLMLKRRDGLDGFTFEGRNRRPPRDPVNAMLSLAYSLLAKDLTVVCAAVGFDPFLGFYHRPRYGRPSLALDLMEEFRPIAADSTVITAVNTGVIGPSDFVRAGGGVNLKPNARKAFIAAYERRMDQLVRHPVFGYQVSYRRVLEVQVRLLGRHLSGEIPSYPEFLTR